MSLQEIKDGLNILMGEGELNSLLKDFVEPDYFIDEILGFEDMEGGGMENQ
eukprot:CAMPEP_0117047942 /NCGR_PEP_ID=MMETSP0472-20121206/33118_1 /TAXON_ID=693140 ORGANISM="Tiarina fusus, Strain LIS" /NCGR_SAMPLE_ID=MMETSP0472 /ASSEMBLY_ACC=CAM_ASM_000603 /LENGTH=50 /DNA_ID=CAMNT_0004760807 /DNA_START=116 /DNA_END=268 /DNA_ORIENTATION=+